MEYYAAVKTSNEIPCDTYGKICVKSANLFIYLFLRVLTFVVGEVKTLYLNLLVSYKETGKIHKNE